MASLGQAVSSVTRPLRTKVKPASVAAQHPAFHKPAAALIPAASEVAPAKVEYGHYSYPWGVTHFGVAVDYGKDAKMVDTDAIKKAFATWGKFTLGGADTWAMIAMQASSALYPRSSQASERGLNSVPRWQAWRCV
eukprot:CAMPEP_0117497294 /NCGR_PEP_ID=MMETSP0784-20121206/21108_1 /TAXON_ID=39447 /ORGANISM="" /LENGTH=135 /DNA_ID=CAMNT_0005292311 /DNA_START=45 /DNA_END=452 /DNA_ORIENTATION=-